MGRVAFPGTARALGLIALGLAALALAMALPQASAQTREALVNPGFEGAATPENGFQLFYGATQVEAVAGACPVSPVPPAGAVRNGNCAVNMGQAGTFPANWSAYSAVKSHVARGNRLADFRTFTGYHDIPNGINPSVNAHYQFFFRIDSTGTTGKADRCIVMAWDSMGLMPASGTGGFVPVTFADSSSSVLYTDSAADQCAGGPATDTMATLQARYPNAHVLVTYVQVVSGWRPNWPANQDIFLDDLSATFAQSASVLAWHSGDQVLVDESTLSSDTYTVTLGRPPAAGETVTVTPVENVPPGAFQQVSISPASVSFCGTPNPPSCPAWNAPQTITVTAVRDYVYHTPSPREITVTHTTTSTSITSGYNNYQGPVVPVYVIEADLAGIVQEAPPPAPFPDRVDLDEATPATTATYDIIVGTAPLPGETITITVNPGTQVTVDVDPVASGNQNVLTLDSSNWNGPHPVLVAVVDDNVDEGHPHTQSITATSTSNIPASPYASPPTNQANDMTAVIRDNDPLVSLGAVLDAYEGGPDGYFTLDRATDTAQAVTVYYTIGASSTATNTCGPGDLCPVLSGSALIPAGQASMQVPVVAFQEGVNEVTETVDVTLSDPSGTCGCAIAAGTVTVNIIDMDQPDVSVARIADAYEDDPGAPAIPDGAFRLYRSNADLAIDVAYTFSGAALTEYAASPAASVHFAVGQFEADVTVTAVDEAVDDPPEDVTLTLVDDTTLPDAYDVAPSPLNAASLSIIGNDPPTVQVTPIPSAVTEGFGATAAYNVSRTLGHAATDPLDVAFSMAGTAVRATDYALSAGVPPAPPSPVAGGTITIPAGSSYVHVFLDAGNDGRNELTETATLNLEPDPAIPAWYQRAAGLEQATVNVLDVNPTVVGIVSSGDATEHLAINGWFTLVRTYPDLPIDVAYALSGTAAPAQYLLSVASPIHFNAGQDTVNVTVQMFDDHVTLFDQTLTMTLVDDTTDPDAYDLSAIDQATIVLHDNENAAVSVARAADAWEGGADGVFNLTRDDPDMPIDVAYTLSGAALLGTDYAALPAGGVAGFVHFNAGQANSTLRVDAWGGDGDEAPETVVVALWPGSYYHVVSPAAATLSVIDTDPPNISPDAFAAYLSCPRLVEAPGLLANDLAPATSTYAAVPDTGATAAGGAYEVLGDGSVRYRPPPGHLGPDSFDYRNTDGIDLSLPAAVLVDVADNVRPTAAFAPPGAAVAGQGVAFVDGSGDFEGPIAAWTWDFGDGTTASVPAALHTFARPGTYVVRLAVEDGQCGRDSATHTVFVGFPPVDDGTREDGAAGDAPRALLANAGPDAQVTEGAAVALHGSVVGAAPGAPIDFAWTQVAGPTVALSDAGAAEPRFSAPAVPRGNSSLVLEFRLEADVDGVAALPGRVQVEVLRIDAPPVVRVKAVPPALPGTSVNLDASGSSDPDGDPLTFRWEQVEGAAASLSDPGSALAAALLPKGASGVLKFRVTVSDGTLSRADTILVTVAAEPLPPAAFAVRPLGSRPEDGYAFASLSPGAVRWSFGDGGFAQGANATHAYGAGGTYVVTMVVQAPGGEPRTASQTLEVPELAPRPDVADPVVAGSQASLWAALALVGLVAVLGGLLLLARLRRRRPRESAS